MMADIQAVLDAGARLPLVPEALEVWHKGGWGMYALFVNGLAMFAIAIRLLVVLIGKGGVSGANRAWRRYWRNPGRPWGTAGRMIAGAMACRTLEETEHYFAELQKDEVAPFARAMPLMKVSVSSAPLLGLLGTVTGMLATFGALATGGGGEKTMTMVAGGISEALITTMTGLVLALSGLILQAILTRQHARFEKLTAHLESLCTQHFRRGAAAVNTGEEYA